MTEVEPVPAVAPAKAVKKKTTPAKPRKVGPSLSDLITKAVSDSKERNGLSLPALKKILTADGYDVENNNSRVKTAVKSLLTKNILVNTKGTGASGSFKVSKEAKKPAAKKAVAAPTVKKAAVKKPVGATPKKAKKPAAKKPSAAKKTTPKKVKKVAPKSPKKVATKSPKKAATKAPKKGIKSPKKAPKPAVKKSPAKKATPSKAAKKAAPKKK